MEGREARRVGRCLRAGLGLLGLSVVFGLALPCHGAVVGSPAPDIASDVWLNGPPATIAELRGQVVLIEFWTFGCYNCRNVEPYVKAWHQRYADRGLVVIGVHSPEFKYERDIGRVKRYLDERRIAYPVLIDNDFAIWNRFGNRYWPAFYLIDKRGVIRHARFGEGGYAQIESWIEALLAE